MWLPYCIWRQSLLRRSPTISNSPFKKKSIDFELQVPGWVVTTPTASSSQDYLPSSENQIMPVSSSFGYPSIHFRLQLHKVSNCGIGRVWAVYCSVCSSREVAGSRRPLQSASIQSTGSIRRVRRFTYQIRGNCSSQKQTNWLQGMYTLMKRKFRMALLITQYLLEALMWLALNS